MSVSHADQACLVPVTSEIQVFSESRALSGCSGVGAAASSAAERAAAAQAAAAGIVADLERRLQASGQPGPEGGLKALALPTQVNTACIALCSIGSNPLLC